MPPIVIVIVPPYPGAQAYSGRTHTPATAAFIKAAAMCSSYLPRRRLRHSSSDGTSDRRVLALAQ